MAQVWHDLLFAHWPMPADALRPFIPAPLELDTYENQAWIAIVPFRMSGIRPRFSPPFPWLSAFPELNVRTYVTYNEKPGVWFFSLEAANPVAVAIARRWYFLPYFYARMQCVNKGEAILYESQRIHCSAPPAALVGRYRPIREVSPAAAGSLVHWFTERYCLYTSDAHRRVYRGEIDHSPWPLQAAEAEFEKNTMTSPIGLRLPDIPPLLHFSRRQDVRVWSLRRAG